MQPFLEASTFGTALLTWAPIISATIAFTALSVNVAISTAQQMADRKISANSVLISHSENWQSIEVLNSGKYPILDLQLYVGTTRVDSVGEQTFIAPNVARKFEVSTEHKLSAHYPHDVTAYFADARGKYWHRGALGLATRLKH